MFVLITFNAQKKNYNTANVNLKRQFYFPVGHCRFCWFECSMETIVSMVILGNLVPVVTDFVKHHGNKKQFPKITERD